MSTPSRGIHASVSQRLKNLARDRDDPFELILIRYGIERFLYRLSLSRWVDRYVVKGSTLFSVWLDQPYRPTRDLDLHLPVAVAVDELESQLREIGDVEFEADGVVLDYSSLRIKSILHEQRSQGHRALFKAVVGKTRIPLQVDFGFGDVITPAPRTERFATLLEMPAPVVQAYPRETFVAEKFQAMIDLDERNTRMKDFADIVWISMHEALEGPLLVEACTNTFEHRGTFVDAREAPAILLPGFYADGVRVDRWTSFAADNPTVHELGSFPEVGERVRRFLAPLWRAMASQDPGQDEDRLQVVSWSPPGPWRTRRAGRDG